MEGNGGVQSCIDLHFGISAIFSYSSSSNRICLFVCLTVLMELLVTTDFNLFSILCFIRIIKKQLFLLTENGGLIIVLPELYAFAYILHKKKMMCWFFVCLFHGIVIQHQGPEHSIQVL